MRGTSSTAGHSLRVQQISVDIGRVMRVSGNDLEALEWVGLLHTDIGKIGVPDNVLNKPDRLTKEERAIMNAHPVIGANIIAPVTKLAPELPIIRHHHEWYNGSGYPDRLIGDEIPKLARILHVADAYEAMTAARPYRMKPLTADQAMAELRKFAGVQFDPVVVDAFTKTHWAAGITIPARIRAAPAGAAAGPGGEPNGRLGDAAGGRQRARHHAAEREGRRSRPRVLHNPGMLLAGIILGLVAGLAAGGRLDNLLAVRLRWTLLIFGALALRLGVEAALLRDVAIVDLLRVPLLAGAYGLLVVALWANRTRPGIGLALVGTALNATAILVNGGRMPVWTRPGGGAASRRRTSPRRSTS